MNTESNPIDLPKLKLLIRDGIEAIPKDNENSQAIIVIGDTGVGKSTILSFLSGAELVVKFDGLKPTLDTKN
jgi:putative ribosome biogenesis GTPase RsgA